MSQVEEAINNNTDIFSQEKEFMDQLAVAGWVPPTDPYERALSATLVQEQVEILKPYVQSLYASRQQTDWTMKKTWESYPLFQVRQTREEFLAACVKRSIEPEQLVDLKQRWDECKFTSITKKWYTLASVSVPRPAQCKLDLQDERDDPAEGADVGRYSLTHMQYQNIIDDIQSLRLKIDGDRFVVVEISGKWFLRGYESFELQSKPSFSVLERYAGEFYVIYPYSHPSIPNYQVKDSLGRAKVLSIRAHPWLLKEQITKVDLHRSKYEGLMVLAGGKEYRAKWVETVEVLIDGDVWEVMLEDREFRLLRPRPGKVPVSPKAARSILGWAIPGRELMNTVVLTKGSVREPLKRVVNSAKVLLMSEKSFWLIRDGIKPLDLIGGTSLEGESPVETACREIYEETGLRLTQDLLVEIGVSPDVMHDQVWNTTLFVAPILQEMRKLSQMHGFTDSISSVVQKFYKQKGVSQIWTVRLLEKIDSMGGADAMRSILASKGFLPMTSHMKLTQNSLVYVDLEYLLARIGHSIPNYDFFEQKVRAKLGWVDSMSTRVHKYWTDNKDRLMGKAKVTQRDKISIPFKASMTWEEVEKLVPRDTYNDVVLTPCGDCTMEFTGWGSEKELDKCDKHRSPFCEVCNSYSCVCGEKALKDAVSSVSDAQSYRTAKAFPEGKVAIRGLLKEIMAKFPDHTISAQTLYKEFSRLGFPGTRIAKVKFMEKAIALGVVSDRKFASGRDFRLQPEDADED
jgi:hypothetical protein